MQTTWQVGERGEDLGRDWVTRGAQGRSLEGLQGVPGWRPASCSSSQQLLNCREPGAWLSWPSLGLEPQSPPISGFCFLSS